MHGATIKILMCCSPLKQFTFHHALSPKTKGRKDAEITSVKYVESVVCVILFLPQGLQRTQFLEAKNPTPATSVHASKTSGNRFI